MATFEGQLSRLTLILGICLIFSTISNSTPMLETKKTNDLSSNYSIKLLNESINEAHDTDKFKPAVFSFSEDGNLVSLEYDLFDYLQNLSARFEPPIISNDLTAKSDSIPSTTTPTGQIYNSLPPTTKKQILHATPTPEPLATSLANLNNIPEQESNWQYGIFDRFTRQRVTTTTQDPRYTLEPGAQIDMRRFNSPECGLRTYDQYAMASDNQHQLLSDSGFDSDAALGAASKDLNQRRQRPALLLGQLEGLSRWTQSFSNNEANQQDQDDISANWPNKDERKNYESFRKQFELSPQSESNKDNNPSNWPGTNKDELNLLSRRNWLQQQLGNTLQMFGLNASNLESNSSWPTTTNTTRENLMKTFGRLRTAKLQAQSDIDPSNLAEPKLEPRVIGGNDARLGDSPWSVSLQALVSRPGTGQVEYRHYCGGTIISEFFILTAAHCLDFMVGRESRLFVVMGDVNWRMSAVSQYGRRIAIDKLIIHQAYKNTAFGHDIGLIRTKERMKPIKANGRYIVNSVCLPEKGIEHSGEAELVGWGLFSNRNEMADALQVAEVPVLPRPLCVDLYRRRTGLIQWLIGIELITDKQVCAGTFGRGICQGDSGSALVFNEKLSHTSNQNLLHSSHTFPNAGLVSRSSRNPDDSRASIIGVVAFGGIRRCSYQSLPGVYMQVSKYMDWILPRIQAS